MTMTIIATYEVRDVDELHELITSLRELEPIKLGCVGTAYAPDVDRKGDMDLTPPRGIERVDMDRAVSVHVSALVAWTIENITSGPVTEVPRVMLRTAFRRLLDDFEDADLSDLMTPVQASCVRGAFADAQGGMVPL
jgi:hypothetical protein